MIRKTVITLVVFVFFITSVYAQENKRKLRIAVMNFSANNTELSAGKACVDILSEKLFSTGVFILLEKSQMDNIARLHGFTEFNPVDPGQFLKLGKILNVDKILVGSISYLDSFIIDVKIADTKTGEIEFNSVEKISSLKKTESALTSISRDIERHYMGFEKLSGKFDITAEAVYIMPYGSFGDIVKNGSGFQSYITFNTPYSLPFNVQIMSGCYSFSRDYDTLNYFYMFPLIASVSYTFILSKNLIFVPSAGAGCVLSKISSEKEDSSLYWNKNVLYCNPAAVLRSEFDILLYDRWYLALVPQYCIFFTDDKIGQFVSFSAGIKMLF